RDGRAALRYRGHIGAIEPPALQEDDRRAGLRRLYQQPLGVVGGGRADGNQARDVGEPLLARVRVAERAAAGAAIGDWAAAAGASLHPQQHRTVPVAEGLVVDARRQPNRLCRRLVVVHKLNLATARPVVGHAASGGDARDELLVERAADRRAGILLHQPLRRVEDAARRAANILPEDEEAGVALDNLDQRIVDRLDHRNLAGRAGWWLWRGGGHLDDALGDTLAGNLRLRQHLVFGGVDSRLGLVAETLDILRLDQPLLDQHLAHALDRVFGAGRLLDLFASAIAANIGAAGVRIEQAAMQVHKH